MTSPASCTDGLPSSHPEGDWLLVGIASQSLSHYRGAELIARYPASTALKGAGETAGSEQTPRGWHQIRARIGAGLPEAAVLRGRRPTGEVWSPELHAAHPGRDWILSRILWLSGLEPRVNRGTRGDGVCVDSMRRYIYIHGTPDSEPMGVPLSHGCVRLRNSDVVRLFEQVPLHTPVLITEAS